MTKKAEQELKKAAARLLELYEIPPSELGRFAFGDTETFWIATVGVNWEADLPPLTMVVADATTAEVLYHEDPIGMLLDTFKSGPERSQRIDQAIAALESGLARLKQARNDPTQAS